MAIDQARIIRRDVRVSWCAWRVAYSVTLLTLDVGVFLMITVTVIFLLLLFLLLLLLFLIPFRCPFGPPKGYCIMVQT